MTNGPAFLMTGSAALLVGSTVVYHVCQKSIPGHVPPVVSAMITLVSALAVSLVLLPMAADPQGLVSHFRHAGWANVCSGVSLVGVVAGHVLYYRSGWTLSTGTFFSYAAVGMVLIPVGTIVFRERIGLEKAAGIALSLAGLYLMTRD